MEINKNKPEALKIKVLKGEKEEIAEVQRVLEEAPDYSLRISGCPPSPGDGKEVFTSIAPGKTHKNKFVFGVYLDNNMIGFTDIIRGYPDETTATIGLLLLSEKHQRKGLGTRAYRNLEEMICGWGNISKIRLGVLATNDIVLPFWEKMGYIERGGRKPYKNKNIKTKVIILEKTIGESKRKIKISKSDFKARLIKLCGKSNLMQFPKRHKDQLVLLASVILNLKPKKQYSEKSINKSIIEWLRKMASKSYLDHVTLRRYLIDFGLLERDPAGHRYHVVESKLSHLFERYIQTIDPFSLIKEFRAQREKQRKEWGEK
jgi:RimJ/RimL family protein N-acetyltransferase